MAPAPQRIPNIVASPYNTVKPRRTKYMITAMNPKVCPSRTDCQTDRLSYLAISTVSWLIFIFDSCSFSAIVRILSNVPGMITSYRSTVSGEGNVPEWMETEAVNTGGEFSLSGIRDMVFKFFVNCGHCVRQIFSNGFPNAFIQSQFFTQLFNVGMAGTKINLFAKRA